MLLNPPDFSDLRRNLCEIHYSLYKPKKTDGSLNLVAFPNMELCSPDTLMGKGKVFYHQSKIKILNLFSIRNELPKSTEETLKFTFKTLFENAVYSAYSCRRMRILGNVVSIDAMFNRIDLSIEDEQEIRYRRDLEKDLPNINEEDLQLYMELYKDRKILSEDELLIVENTNIDFFQTTYSFWRSFVSQKGDVDERKRINQPILEHLSPDSLLLNRDYYKALKIEGKWTAFIRLTCKPIPVAQLAKLNKIDELSIGEKGELKNWVKAINDCSSITVSLLTTVLLEVIRVIQIEGSSTVILQDILFWLHQEGCQLLNQEDEAHMEKRGELATGSTIVCNGKKLILGNKLSADKNIPDPFVCFELRDYPDYVVKVAQNRLQTLTEDFMRQNEHCGVRLARVIEDIENNPCLPPTSGIDMKGRCMVVEKLDMDALKKEWVSDHPELDSADEEKVLILASHFKWMRKGNFFANLNEKNLGRDALGLLKATQSIKKEEADYNKWEWLALRHSKGNIFVLNALMEISDWKTYPIAIFYREEIARTLHAGWIGERINFIPDGFDKTSYYRHADALCQDALDQLKECQAQVKNLLKISNDQQKIEMMKKEVAARMIYFYNLWPIPGFLPPYLVQAVVDSFKDDFREHSRANWEDYAARQQNYYPHLFDGSFIAVHEIRRILDLFQEFSAKTHEFHQHEKYYLEKKELLKKYNKYFKYNSKAK